MTTGRWTIVEGSYRGTTDDVYGRWYVVDRDGDIIDKRGRGYSKADARELARSLEHEPCAHKHVSKDDDGRDYWFYVCDDCDKVVSPTEDGWEVFE